MKASIRAVLVDDEPPARERLATLLRALPQVEIVGEADDVESAVETCARELPDLIFLDIQLPRGSGFDLLPRLTGKPAIIFVTASNQSAVRAFEVNALDYLLKPIHPDRLTQALARMENPHHPAGQPDLVSLSEDRATRLVPLNWITHIKADDNYSNVHLLNHPHAMVRRSLTEWEKTLPPDDFLRVDRSLIVRLSSVQMLQTQTRDSTLLFLTGQEVPIVLGRRGALHLRRFLKKD